MITAGAGRNYPCHCENEKHVSGCAVQASADAGWEATCAHRRRADDFNDRIYYVQAQFKGTVKKGDLWRDVIRIPQEKLNHIETIGLGVTRPPSETFHIDRGLTDWDGHRLCIPVK